MSANYIQVPPQGTGLKVDTSELTSGANTVERQNVCLADPSTATSVAAVKAASTAAVASDPSLVVAISPNHAVGTKGQATMANSVPVTIASNQGAIGSAVIQAVAGTALAADVTNSELRVSTYVKSAAAGDTALTLGQGTKAASLPVVIASDQLGTQTKAASISVTQATDQLGQAAMAASIPVVIASDQSFVGTKAAGTAAANSILDGAVYNSTIPAPTTGQQLALQADSTGAVYVNTSGRKATYCATLVGLNPGTAATSDIFTIYGTNGKNTRIKKVVISGTQATAVAYADFVLALRSAAPSGGAATTASNIPLMSSFPASSAVVKGWTTAPTAGAAIGNITSAKYFLPITGATQTQMSAPLVFTFGDLGGSNPVTLLSAAEGLAITMNGATPANAPNLDIYVEWTEDV